MSWKAGLWAFARDDRVVFLCVGLAAFSVVNTMRTVLNIIRDTNEIPPSEPKTQYITQDTEDALQLHTLTKLLEHPNFSIRDIATKILCDRAVNDPGAMTYLLYGITVKSYDERLYCLRALSLLTNQTFGLDGLSKLNTPKAYSALVRSLEQSLGDGDEPVVTNIHWDEYYLRDTAERFCLKFLQELTGKYGANMLIKAKFVEKWLVKQKWGDTPERRKQHFKAYKEVRSNRIVDIVSRIEQCRRGLRALEKSGLVDKDNSRRRMRELPDLLMEVGDVIGEAPPTDGQLRRAREHSAEERRLRRQHREAMVLNDGTRPLAREDIIERDHSSPA
ncbi:hypothetical protein CCM_06397 [Cordyceps militaris CM01]|uniref:Cytoskeleton-associated protein n=1 Tax=Cordyceps militaris (strain CM01) TaxID=983644 RepID=G3JKF8_CORMM|nr:uncharacterized protein CCM_06397 [Cordyceps militaris CM01]EGX92236.1 hypothetical protein CCM_06397 [Cordyceps militaris CM01]